MEEEKRLKAVIEFEKTKCHCKEDMQSAWCAEQQLLHERLEVRLKKN
jgi:hypothetical protein